MGRRLLKLLGSEPGFLRIGETAAVLRGAGNEPVVREEWMIAAIRGSSDTHTRSRIQTHTHTRSDTHTHTHRHTHTHTLPYLRVSMRPGRNHGGTAEHTHLQDTEKDTQMHKHTPTSQHTQTHTHTYPYTPTHILTHTQLKTH